MKRWTALFLSILLSVPAWAQVPLTWQDCVTLAAKHNPDLLSALNAMEASRAQYRGSFNGILPQINLEHTYTDSSTSRTALLSDGTLGAVTSESKTWQAQGSVSLNLINFGQWASIASASAVFHQSQANLEVAGSNVLLNLYKAFASLLYAQNELQVATNIRDTWKMNADMVNLRYKSGSESRGNNMNTQAQLLQSEVNVTQAGRDIEVAQQQLSQVLGFDEFKALVASGTWTTTPAPQTHPDFSAILAHIPQIRAQEAAVDQARAAVTSAHATLWPTLSVNYTRGVLGPSEFPSDPFWTFTGLVSYPLFSGGPTATYYASQAAERSYERAQSDLRSLRNQTLTNLESAWSSFALAQDQVRVQKAFLDADQQRKAESDILYQSGLFPFQEWIIVVTEYVNFQTSFLRAEQNLLLAEAQWRFATGEVLGD